MSIHANCSVVLLLSLASSACDSGNQSNKAATADTTPPPSGPAAAVAAVGATAALLPSNATGCAPGSRCISVTRNGQPSTTDTFVAQCRGKFADYIVSKRTIPTGYAGPWFKPELIENATTNGPTATRPWMSFDPAVTSQRLKYLLALRNYAFTSRDLRAYTPQFTADASYRDAAGGGVTTSLRTQKWYPAPRMIYLKAGGTGTREAAKGMTLERTVDLQELAENSKPFRNYAVAYYDARGASAYRKSWSTATPGLDLADRAAMRMPEGSLVYKLLFSAAKPGDFPVDILQNSVPAAVLPAGSGTPLPVRLLQIDIAVKDSRSGPTGWYFATYAYDRNASNSSPWRRMSPVGLMWGNDPNSDPVGTAPMAQSWINPNAPQYARDHLGIGGRLNGPVDNRASACMSCHSTAQAPSVAQIIPTLGCAVAPFRKNWFRNLPGTQAFGRFSQSSTACTTTPPGDPVGADYSLQLGGTVTRSLQTPATANPCTWDSANPPAAPPVAAVAAANEPPIYPVTRDPEQ